MKVEKHSFGTDAITYFLCSQKLDRSFFPTSTKKEILILPIDFLPSKIANLKNKEIFTHQER